MPNYLKIIAAFVIIIVLVLLGWLYFKSQGTIVPGTATTTAEVAVEAPINTSPDINSTTDSSDAALDQDLAAIDGQIKNLGLDEADVAQGLKNQNEVPVQ